MRVEARRLSMNSRRNVIAALVLSFMMIAISPFIGSGVLFANEGDQTETTGLAGCSLVFSYTNTSTGTTKSTGVRIGDEDQIGPLLNEIGITNGEQEARGGIENVVSDAPNIVRVYDNAEWGWFYKTLAADEDEHDLTVNFNDGHQIIVKITTHKHYWTATGDKSAKLTIKCDDVNCYYLNSVYTATNEFAAEISASDTTYDGNPHGAEKKLQTGKEINFPKDVVDVGEIHYTGIEGTTYADSTTVPTDAGKYKAYYEVKPQGQDDVFTVQTTYTIAKANIKFEPEPAPASNLVYNGQDQDLYTLGTAKSTVTSGLIFPIKYWYEGDSSQKFVDQMLTGKDGTVKVSYQAEGDANHNATEVKTIEINIGKRSVTVSEITADNKVYDGTTAATLNCDGAEFAGILEGDNLTVSGKGTFADRSAEDNKTVNLTELTLGGEDADKYTLAATGQQESATANITAKTIKVKWQESDKLPYTGEEQAPKAEFDFAEELTPVDGKAYTGDDVQPVITGKHKELAVWTASVNSLSGDDASNYKLDSETSNVNYEYEIVPKELTVTWEDTEKEYDAKGLEPDYSLDGFVGGDKPSEYLSFTANPTELVGNKPVNAGSYKAKLELTGETATNYEITNPETPFTITKAPLTVKANDNAITYGQDPADAGVTYSGFQGDDDEGVLEGSAEYSYDYKRNDKPGSYTITPSGLTATNYKISFEPGTLTVNKRSNTLKIKGKTAKVKSKKLKKKTQKLAVTKVIRFTKKGQGKMTYKLVSAKKGKKSFKKYIKINAKTGKVTVKKNKKMKKGTYKVKVKAKAAGNDTYMASSWRTVTFKIRVK